MSRLKKSWVLVTALWLSGCGGGDTLPLVPAAGTCDRPVDPFWSQLSPLCGSRAQLDAVWSADGKVCVVGTSGLVLLKQGDHPFLRENPGTTAHLFSVAVTDDEIMVAVGDQGTVCERTAVSWTSRQVAGADALRTVITTGSQAYAVGDQGAVTARDAQGVWRLLDFPGNTDLTGVAVRGDTLAVSGAGGAFWLLTDDQWIDLSEGPWLDHEVHSVFWLEDGRFLAVADRYYLKSPEGWEIAQFGGDYSPGTGLRARYAAERLWVTSTYELIKVNPTVEPWPWDHLVSGDGLAVGARDSDQALISSTEGDLIWYRSGDRTWDPAGLNNFDLFRLDDGTVGVRTDEQLLVPGPLGLEPVLNYSDLIEPTMGWPRAIAGRTLDDLYLAHNSEVWHLYGEQLERVTSFPTGDYVDDLILDSEGGLHLSTRGGLYLWDGTQLEQTLEIHDNHTGPEFSKTRQGTLVANLSYYIWYLGEGGWVSLDRQPLVTVGEPQGGDLLFFYDAPLDIFQVRRQGVGVMAEGLFDPAPVCEGLDFRGGVDSPYGVYIFSSDPSLVFRLEGDPLLGNWDLVAGPLEDNISDLEVMADGSLLAKTYNNPDGLYIHVPR